MKRFQKWLALWGIGTVAVLTALTLTTATYAWFSTNREVETSRVTSRTGSEQLELQISNLGGQDFAPMKDASGTYNEVPLKQRSTPLLPVSTADLDTFVYCPFTVDNNAEHFLQTTDEAYYYHDTIYLKAAAQGFPQGSRMALYLDNAEEPIVQADGGELLTAARLGLTFDGKDPVIFSLSDVNEGTGNSRPGGVPLESGKVLTVRDGEVVPEDDPAIALADGQLFAGGDSDQPPIAYLELNRVYAVDVYFYLEGCDPDCLDRRVGQKQAVLNLAFFGLLEE